MKNESLIYANYYNTSLPNRCIKFAISIAVFLLAAFNLWWFMIDDHDIPQLNYDNPPLEDAVPAAPAVSAAPAAAAADATFCNSRSMDSESCDIFKGKWIPDPSPPLYTNNTCRYIFANQDCMTNGRPDRGFIHWKWKPNDCEIPAFDPALFLHLMTGKKMLFVGDSLARNQMQSLLCSIAQVETPEDVRRDPENQGMEYAWSFGSYNFTLAMAVSSFLVDYTVEEGTWKINVDKTDERWASTLGNYEVAVFSTLYWYFRRSIYYMEGKRVSEYDPGNETSTEALLHVMKHVWSTVLKYLVENYKGIAILRTVSVSHFENPWDQGGTCFHTHPSFDPHMSLPPMDNEILTIQKNAFHHALHLSTSTNSNSSCRLKLLDVTSSTLLRPDGHPGAYRIQNPTERRNDCVHWCMPGPIDTWNQLLFADPQIMCP